MRLSQLGEFGLIDRIARREKKLPKTVIGIGDDAAVIEIPISKPACRQGRSKILNKSKILKSKSQKYLLVTTDTSIENIHFRLKNTSFFHLGQKVLAANISDIAAMGGYPTHALVTVGLPKTISVKAVDELYRGIDKLAQKCRIDIIGGDTVASPKEIVISIVVLGEVEKKNLLLRSTAKVGDLICVTGRFGKPAATKFVLRPLPAGRQASSFVLRLKEARVIAKAKVASSLIDSSDGLVRSVIEICKASKVGAKIWLDAVPIARGATLDQALYGGEEYELVFTAPRSKVKKLKGLKVKTSVVGEIVDAKLGVKLVDIYGKVSLPKSGGYEHFK